MAHGARIPQRRERERRGAQLAHEAVLDPDERLVSLVQPVWLLAPARGLAPSLVDAGDELLPLGRRLSKFAVLAGGAGEFVDFDVPVNGTSEEGPRAREYRRVAEVPRSADERRIVAEGARVGQRGTARLNPGADPNLHHVAILSSGS